jgi:hypothetical protein
MMKEKMMRSLRMTVLLALPLALSAATNDFNWSGRLAPGQTLEIKGVNGWVRAERASGVEAQVTANKTGRRSDPDSVRIQVVPHADGVTICAVYPSNDSRGN